MIKGGVGYGGIFVPRIELILSVVLRFINFHETFFDSTTSCI